MADEPYEATRAAIEAELMKSRELCCVARDLGFSDHTAINDAAQAIIARGMSGILFRLGYRPKTNR